jgi:hypothetical protein
MNTRRNDVVDDVIPEFDFSRAIPNPFAGLIGPNYKIYSHGIGSDRQSFAVVSTRRPGGRWLDFVDLEIPSCPAAESGNEWIAREAIGQFLGIDRSSFDLIIEVQGGDPT